jgi:taurine---2-oxoglutarate transaminase
MSLQSDQAKHVFFTWTAQNAAQPLEIVSGEGSRVRGVDGTLYWDLASTTWNANLGHAHPGMIRALEEAVRWGVVAGPSAVFPAKARAGELLAEIAPPGLEKSFLCLSGAEANENAIKMARLLTGRRKVVTRTRSYHGATLAMLSLSGDPRRDPFEPLLPGVVRMASPYCYRCPFGKDRATCGIECADDLESQIQREGPDTIAAVLLEGVTGANGVLVPRDGYWRRVREICDRHGILLIADEVLSGFGRTGRWFAVDHESVIPDMITCAKGLTAGYAPGGAVLVNERVARHFDDHTLLCGLTAYAHPLTCAAIVGAITAYREEGLLERASELGRGLEATLASFRARRPFIGEARGVGLLWGLELVVPGTRDPIGAAQMAKLAPLLRKHGLIMHKRDNLLYIAPPLVISATELDEAIATLGVALDEAFT